MSSLAKGRGTLGTNLKLVFIDVKRAYFYADARRSVYVKLPAEDSKDGYCGRLVKAMYGTRDAASCWEEKYRTHLEKNGFVCGASSPCVLFNKDYNVRLVVHGDDFTFL